MLSTDVTLSDQTVTELGEHGALLYGELEAAHTAKAEAEARIERARTAIEILMGDADEATVNGRAVITRHAVQSRRFDQQTAKRFLTAEQVEACMVPTESRPFKRVGQ